MDFVRSLIWKKSEPKVQLVRVSFFRSDFLQNPYLNKNIEKLAKRGMSTQILYMVVGMYFTCCDLGKSHQKNCRLLFSVSHVGRINTI
jgi:hypothetical protein